MTMIDETYKEMRRRHKVEKHRWKVDRMGNVWKALRRAEYGVPSAVFRPEDATVGTKRTKHELRSPSGLRSEPLVTGNPFEMAGTGFFDELPTPVLEEHILEVILRVDRLDAELQAAGLENADDLLGWVIGHWDDAEWAPVHLTHRVRRSRCPATRRTTRELEVLMILPRQPDGKDPWTKVELVRPTNESFAKRLETLPGVGALDRLEQYRRLL